MLITGGLGQLGLGLAEAARQKGYAVTLVGRSPLDQKPAAYGELVSRLGATFHALDVYDTAADTELIVLASDHLYWIHAAEPAEAPVAPEWVRLHTQYLYAVAKKAGFVRENSAGKRFVRIGSPPPEIWEDSHYEAQFGRLGYVEDQPLDETYCAKPSFQSAYFQTKMLLKQLAEAAYASDQIAVVTASPTLVLGPYGFGPYKEIWPQVLRGDWPFNLIYPTDAINAIPLTQAAEGILLAAERGVPGEHYQLSGPNVIMGYLLDRMRNSAGRKRWSFHPELPVRLPASAGELNSLEKGIDLLTRWGVGERMGLDPQVLTALKIITMIGSRSAQKAREQLHFDPGGWGQIDHEISRMRDWYSQIGLIA